MLADDNLYAKHIQQKGRGSRMLLLRLLFLNEDPSDVAWIASRRLEHQS